MIAPFNCTLFPPLAFGEGVLSQLPRFASYYGTRAYLVHGSSFASKGLLDRTLQALAGKGVRTTTGLVNGEPTVEMVDRLAGEARSRGIEIVIAIGGGSVLDAGKAIAAMAAFPCSSLDFLEGIGTRKHPGTCLPWIAVPTTAGTGSEATTNTVLRGIGANGIPFKKSMRHPLFLPQQILLDPSLQIGMPLETSAACAMDACSQLLEAYTSTTASPLTDAIALEGLRHMGQGLAHLVTGQDTLAMRSHLAMAALCSGFGLSNAGLGLVHGVAGLLGAAQPIPHGIVCATLIAPAFAATQQWLEANPSPAADTGLMKLADAARALSPRSSAQETPPSLVGILEYYVARFGIPRLQAYGFTAESLRDIAQQGSNRNSPARLDMESIHAVLLSRL